jgi:two-component system cell cycle sensor histidine kinase/response regulator CckA
MTITESEIVVMTKRLAVLLVEDSENDAQLIVRLLTKAGYDVIHTRVETIAQMNAALEMQHWDIVIADYSLPQFSGYEALKTLQKTGTDIPFIAVSGVIGEETAAAMMKAGAHDYLKKDNLARLALAVERELVHAEVRREHYRDAERLRESEIFVKDILNSLPFQVAVLDQKGEIITVNEAWKSFAMANSATDCNYYVGSNYLTVAKDAAGRDSDEVAETALRGIEAVIENVEEFFSLEYPCHSLKEKRWFVMRVSSLSGVKRGVVVAHIDITQSRLAKEEQEKLEAQLLQAQKMEALGKMAGGVAHDFNNMLTVIKGYAELVMRKLTPTDPICAYINEIEKASRNSEDLVRQLLAFARKQTIEPTILHLDDVIVPMLSILSRLIGEKINLVWKTGGTSWHVKMDPTQISQMLVNLAVNARDAISGIGTVTIETGSVNIDKLYSATHRGLVPGEYVLLTVSDNGRGMGKETLTRIFEPFFTTKPQGKGTGLGLATVYGIVKQNKGFIYVYSEPEKGTTFKIYLPRSEPDRAVFERNLLAETSTTKE